MKIFLRSSFWLAAALAVMLTALGVLKDIVLFPFVEWYLRAALREEFATTLTMEGMEGNLLSDLRIRGFTLEPLETGKVLDFLGAEGIVLRYYLPDLLGGWQNFLHNIHCDIYRAHVNLAFVVRGDESPPTQSSEPVTIPLFLPSVTLHDSAIQISMEDGGTVQSTGIAVHLGMSSPTIPFLSSLSAENLTFKNKDQTLFSSNMKGAFRIGETGVEIDTFLLADREIIQQGSFLFSQDRAENYFFTANILPFAGTLQLSAVLSDQVAKVSLKARDFDLDEASAWLPLVSGIIAGKIQADGDIALHLADHPYYEGTYSLAAQDGSWRGSPFQKITVKGSLDRNGIILEEAVAKTPSMEALLHNFSLAYDFPAPVEFPELLRGLHGSFTLRSQDIPGLLHSAGVKGHDPFTADIPLHNLSLSGSVDKQIVHISQGQLTSDTIRIDVGESSLGLPVQGPFSKVPVRIRLGLQIDSLEDAAAIFSLPDIAGKAEAEVDLSGSFAAFTGTGHVSATSLAFKGASLGDLEADLVADSKTVKARNFSLKNNGDVLKGDGVLRLADHYIEHVQLNGEFQEESLLLAAFLPDTIGTKGPLLINVTGQGPLADPDFTMRLEADEISSGSLPITEVTLSLKKEKTHLDINPLRLQTPYGMLNVVASAEKDAAKESYLYKITTLDISSDNNIFSLVEQAAGQITWPRVDIDSLQLQSNAARIGVSGIIDIQGNSSVTLAATELSSDQLPPSLLQDKFSFHGADVTMVFDGPLQNPALRGKGSIAGIAAPQLPFPIQGNFDMAYRESRITLDHFLWTSSDGIRLEANGTLPFQPRIENMLPDGPLTLRARVTVPELSTLEPFIPDLRTAGGTVGIDVNLTGNWREPLGHIRINGQNITVPESVNYGVSQLSSVSAELLSSRNSLLLQNVKIQAEGAELTLQGKWINPPEVASLVSGQWRDSGGDIHVEGSLSMVDIGALPLTLEGVRRISGSVRAEATLDGQPTSLKLGGRIFLENGEIRAEFLPASAREISIKADFDQHGITLNEMHAELGGAPLNASGTITFVEGGLVTDLLVTGENLLLARDDGMLIRSDASISLTGPLASWNITGDMAITDGRITRQIDFLGMLKGDNKPKASGQSGIFSFSSPPLRDALLNMNISSKNPLRIKNNLFTGTIRPQLTLKGTGELPFLEGRVYIDQSRLKLPSGKIIINSGIITFPKENPDNPRIDIKAGSKMIGYDISIQILGNLDEPVVTLSSVPPVPSDQLLLLLLTGQAPTQGVSAEDRKKSSMKLALYFGRDFISRWLYSDEVDDDSVLDRFDLDIGRDITKSGDDTIDASFELSRDIFKRSGIYFITAEKDVYDDFNMGLKIVFRLKD